MRMEIWPVEYLPYYRKLGKGANDELEEPGKAQWRQEPVERRPGIDEASFKPRRDSPERREAGPLRCQNDENTGQYTGGELTSRSM